MINWIFKNNINIFRLYYLNMTGIINFLKPQFLTFTNRVVSGMGFGFGMGIAWKLQPDK